MNNLTRILKKTGLLIILFAITLASCEKEESKTKVKPNGVALKQAIQDLRDSKTQSFPITLSSTGNTVMGEQGTEINFYAGSLKDKDGNIVTGDVEVKLLEIYSKADMLLMNKTTMGKLPNGDHAMLVSGGEFLLSANQNGEELELNGMVQVKLPTANTGGGDNEMTLFTSDFCSPCDEDCDGIVCEDDVWVEKDDTLGTAGQGGLFVETFGGVDFYIGFISDFGWTNVDKFYSYTGLKTTLLVQAPEAYDNTNCAIYLSYDGEDSGLASLDSYNSTTGLFTEHYGQIPVGLDVHIIAISNVDDQYYSTIKAVTIVENGTIVLDNLLPTTEAELTADINALP